MHGVDQSKGYSGRSNQLFSVKKGVGATIVAANEFKTVTHTQCTWVQYIKENQFSTKEGEDKDPICASAYQGKACGKEPGQECYCKIKMECFIPPGQGTDLKFSIVIGDQESNSWMFSYAPPHVLDISTGHAGDPVSTFPGKFKDGPQKGRKKSVTITGSNFGLPASMFKTVKSI